MGKDAKSVVSFFSGRVLITCHYYLHYLAIWPPGGAIPSSQRPSPSTHLMSDAVLVSIIINIIISILVSRLQVLVWVAPICSALAVVCQQVENLAPLALAIECEEDDECGFILA